MEGIGDAGLQSLDGLCLVSGDPLELLAADLDDLAALVQDLERGAGQLVLAADGLLRYRELREAVLDQQDAVLGDLALRGDAAVRVDGEGGVAGDCIAVGGDGLTQDVGPARLETRNRVRLVAGYPLGLVAVDVLGNLASLLVDDLDGGAGQLVLAARRITLRDGDGSDVVLDEDDTLRRGLRGSRHLAGRIDGEPDVSRQQAIALRGDGLAQQVFLARGEAKDLVRFVAGHPLDLLVVCHDYLAGLGVNNLDGGAGDLFAAADGDLGDGDLGKGVLDENDATLDLGPGDGHLAGLVDREGGVGGEGVSVGSDGLAQGVGLANREAEDLVDGLVDVRGGLVVNLGGPLLDDLALGGQDLNLGARQLVAEDEVYLGDLDGCQRVLDEKDAVLGDGAGTSHLAVLVDREGGVGGDGVAVGGDGLAQGVGLVSAQAADLVDGLVDVLGGLVVGLGYPLLDDLALGGQDLDGCSGQLLAAGDVCLGDLDGGQAVLDEDDALVHGRGGLARVHGAVCVQNEGGVAGDEVAGRSDGLAQRVGNTRREADDLVRLCRGGPLNALAVDADDFAVLVKDLNLCAHELFAGNNVCLGNLD